jgi:uncharacterized membrane protein
MVPSMDETRDQIGDATGSSAHAPLKSCPQCAAQMPGTAAFCPGCGRSMLDPNLPDPNLPDRPVLGQPVLGQPVLGQPMLDPPMLDPPAISQPMQTEVRAQGRVGALPENIAGALAYFTFVPAIAFLVLEPYSKNRFTRFHSVQSLLLWGASVLFAIALKLASVVLFIIPVLGPLLVWLVSTVVALAAVVIWVVLVVKALQGEMFKLPLLGDFAAQQAGEL